MQKFPFDYRIGQLYDRNHIISKVFEYRDYFDLVVIHKKSKQVKNLRILK